MAGAFYDWNLEYDRIDLDDAKQTAIAAIERAYVVSLHESEQTWHDSIADQYAEHDHEMAKAERDYTVAVTEAAGVRDNGRVGAYQSWWQTMAPLDKAFQDDVASAGAAQSTNDATAEQSFKTAVANDYVAELETWNTSVATPWSEYNLALAEAEQERLTTLTGAAVSYVTSVGNAEVAYVDAVGEAEKTYNLADAAAYVTRTGSIVTRAQSLRDQRRRRPRNPCPAGRPQDQRPRQERRRQKQDLPRRHRRRRRDLRQHRHGNRMARAAQHRRRRLRSRHRGNRRNRTRRPAR